ncbi:MAG: sugar phosphate isomerase/epimerase [Firmicutes bacterium]|nr:sugar phosphate isomerase/epimerase [Bacillota bacterium]
MILNRDNVYLSDGGSPEKIENLIRGKGYNMETLYFAMPDVLTGDLEGKIRDFSQKRDELGVKKVIMHGPFFDLTVASLDPEIVKITLKRYEQALATAQALHIEKIVLHTQFNAQLKIPAYINNWLIKSMDYFSGIVQKLEESRITILIENMFDEDPDIMVELLEKINSPCLGVCLDAGHVNAFSRQPQREWIKQLGKHIRYVHLSDNDGLADEHYALGRGNIDFPDLFGIFDDLGVNPEFCIEMNSEKDHLESIAYLKKINILDPDF